MVIKHDRYSLPTILDLSSKLHRCRYFSVIDLVKGYHQVPMAPKDIQKTAIITPFGLFEYLFMPFGLMNAAQTFQRLMDRLLGHFPLLSRQVSLLSRQVSLLNWQVSLLGVRRVSLAPGIPANHNPLPASPSYPRGVRGQRWQRWSILSPLHHPHQGQRW